MTGEELQLLIIGWTGKFDQAQTVDGGAMNAGEIGIVVFVAGVGRLAEMLAGEGMDHADVPVGFAKGTLHGTVVFAGLLNGDDQVLELVLLHGVADAVDGGAKGVAVMG